VNRGENDVGEQPAHELLLHQVGDEVLGIRRQINVFVEQRVEVRHELLVEQTEQRIATPL